MTEVQIKSSAIEEATWSNSHLVRECLAGNEAAWAALIDKYKNLIYSIPIKRGFSPEDAADLFQSVCLDLLSELQRLRDPEALPCLAHPSYVPQVLASQAGAGALHAIRGN
jgi:hypothetical protein